MPSASLVDVIIRARKLAQIGDYSQAASVLDRLPVADRTRAEVGFERASVRASQGDIVSALAALDEVDLSTATPSARRRLALERANLRVFQGAFEDARTVLADEISVDRSETTLVDHIEADFLSERLTLMAGVYREVPTNVAEAAGRRLPDIADRLERAGRPDRAFAVRLLHAQRHGSDSALGMLARRAQQEGHPAVAARAHLSQALDLLDAGQPEVDILGHLDRADALFESIGHVHGPTDVRAARLRVGVERAFADPVTLEPVLHAYRELEYSSAELSLLLDLSGYAHVRGRTDEVRQYREVAHQLSERIGMGLSRFASDLASADLHVRNGAYREAIEVCEAALDALPPAFIAASFETITGVAYSFVGDSHKAAVHHRRAVTTYEQLGDQDAASDVVASLALSLASVSLADPEPDRLLADWRTRDLAREDWEAAIAKSSAAGQLAFLRYNARSPTAQKTDLLDVIEAHLADAEDLTRRLPPHRVAVHKAGFHQTRGQVATARGAEEAAHREWTAAREQYETAGMEMETANSAFILGIMALKRAASRPDVHFEEAERAFGAALAYYDRVDMRRQAANTRFMFATLYIEASVHVFEDVAAELRTAALDHVRAAEADYDAIRQDFTVGSVLDAQRGKEALVAASTRLYALALEIVVLHAPDAEMAWNWVQRSKARALSDALGLRAVAGRALSGQSDAVALVREEEALLVRLAAAPADQRAGLREAVDEVRLRMAVDPAFDTYLDLRTGRATESDDLDALLAPDQEAGRTCVCVDWFTVGGQLWIVARRPGARARIRPVGLRFAEVEALVRERFGKGRAITTLLDHPDDLYELAPLIAPLAELSDPGDLLILSPTGPLHALPLHALPLGDDALIVRNPLVYTPSLAALRYAQSRGGHGSLRTAALFGDPSEDRTQARVLVERLAEVFDAEVLLGASVTRAAFERAVVGVDLVHFQGHAKHNAADPLTSHLSLADGFLTASDVFGVSGLTASLVTLGACESAVSRIQPGDEPQGLVPAFLFGGAAAVLASLWQVEERAAALFMEQFYAALPKTETRAHAFREASLAVRASRGHTAPYFWAAFTLNGSWL